MKKKHIYWALIFFLLSASCIEREMTITSDPPEALVFVSDVEIGRTPVTFSFTKYGEYDIMLRCDGYQTLKTSAKIDPPWYAVPPLDLASDIAPWTYHDRRFLHFRLKKQVLPSEKILLEHAERMKAQNNQ